MLIVWCIFVARFSSQHETIFSNVLENDRKDRVFYLLAY